eukprot:CAMPEP_0119274484 /NCGR_PEP_ID=MMETSP1329-20130426/12197_1 /TAXON_ID=114041 /ORGANISM="Genus nov. species nov., Strain RCC1024" /LENGTH=152 /DNA_ID=CAMNT_0007274807 /DNA_START=133 /DNA_END=588 /DNA_ORIENTATION=+
MGQFSYGCSKRGCNGGNSQFDWAARCVVALALTTGKKLYVHAYYEGYGYVVCRVGQEHQVKVHLSQFAEFFKSWGDVQVIGQEIYCNAQRRCVPSNIRVLNVIPERSFKNLERLSPADGGIEGDTREAYDEVNEGQAEMMQLPGLLLDQLLG